MSFDLEAVRGRFPALASGVAFLDAPGGTQCPQSVIDAISAYTQAKAVGQPAGSAIYFAVDYNAPSSDISGAIDQYFRCVT